MREEHARMRKRMEKLQRSVANTPGRKQPWAVKSEIEMLRANLAALERRYSFD